MIVRNITCVLASSIVSKPWDGAGNSNPNSWKTKARFVCLVYGMAADDLAKQEDKAWTAIVLS